MQSEKHQMSGEESFLSHSIFRSLTILALPFVQYLILRVFIHQYLQIRIGWGGILTDFDLLLPVPIAFAIWMEFLQRDQVLTMQLRRSTLALNLFLFMTFFCAQFFFNDLQAFFGSLFFYLWWAAIGSVFLTSLFVFIRPRFYFHNKNRLVFFPCALIAVSSITYQGFLEPTWRAVVHPLATLVCGFMQFALGDGLACGAVSGGGKDYVGVGLSGFRVLIGQGCGGMDAFLMFTFCFLIFYIMYRNRLNALMWGTIFLWGILLMAGLNVLRIGLVFFLGVFLKTQLPTETGVFLYKNIVHANLGWVLYLVGIAVFFKQAVRIFKLADSSQKLSDGAGIPKLQ